MDKVFELLNFLGININTDSEPIVLFISVILFLSLLSVLSILNIGIYFNIYRFRVNVFGHLLT